MYSSLFSMYKWFDICIMLWNDHHGKSSYHLSPYKVITMLLTLFPMLYIISSWLSYFIAESLYILLLQLFLSFLFWEFPNIHKNGENVTTISDPMKSGSGNPLQYSCLENPRDRGAWWATVHGVAKSQTWLKQLSTAQHSWHSSYFV